MHEPDSLPPVPTTLSAALTMALDDVDEIRQNPKYVLAMGTWHSMSWPDRTTCHVCMAGAVMATRLLRGADGTYDPEDFGDSWRRVFWAIDDMRGGHFISAYRMMIRPNEVVLLEVLEVLGRVATMVNEAREGRDINDVPWEVYRKAAALLKEAGL